MPSRVIDTFRGRSPRALPLAVAVGALIAGCSSAGTAGTTSAGADGGSAPVQVGLVYSRSGPLAAFGKQYEQGFKAGLAYATHGTDKAGGHERRVEVLGLRPYGFKLIAFVLAGTLAALGGIVYLLLTGGATPHTTTSDFTLSLLVMVVLGGSGTRWGPMIGGILYTWADQRLGDLAGSGTVTALPSVLRMPLSQPLFLIGALFVAVIYLLPGGVARLPARLRSKAPGVR